MALSAEQQKIVHCPVDRHAVVRAVAGSGKSHTMTERVAYLIEAHRVDPTHIIAVMFNKSASEEFTERLEKRLGKRNSPESVTYHRLGTLTLNRLIRAKLAPSWTFEANVSKARQFAIKVIRPYIRNVNFPNLIADSFLGFVDRVKGDLADPVDVWALGEWPANYEWFIECYPAYERARAEAKIRFFSDLIYDAVDILRESPEARRVAAERYKHIIIDEYQDICESQQALIRYVAGNTSRVMVVGDEDQTIYAWRGAKPSYILFDFVKDFPGALEFQLTRTWRYGHALSCAANYVITHNTMRADKLCISGDAAPKTTITLHSEEVQEKEKDTEGKPQKRVPSKMESLVDRLLAKGCRHQDIAVLVRTYSASAGAQFALLERAIPFRLEGGDKASVLDNPFVANLIGWMQLAAGRIAYRPYAGDPDPGSIFGLRPLLEVPRTGLQFEASKELCICVLKEPDGIKGFETFIRSHLVGVGAQVTSLDNRLRAIAARWDEVRSLSSNPRIEAFKLIEHLMKLLNVYGVIEESISKPDDQREAIELIQAFLVYAEKHAKRVPLATFLDHIENLRSFSDRAKAATDAVHMTSLHRSKGLEWDYVIMPGLAQGRFPLMNKHVTEEKWPAHLEDERRLFYVGMTRARRELHLIAPQDTRLEKHLAGGNSGSPDDIEFSDRVASQFIYESNLYFANRMPATVLGKPPPAKVGSPEIFNRYLQEVGSDFRVAKYSLEGTSGKG